MCVCVYSRVVSSICYRHLLFHHSLYHPNTCSYLFHSYQPLDIHVYVCPQVRLAKTLEMIPRDLHVEVVNTLDKDGNPPLLLACRLEDGETAFNSGKILLEYKCDTSVQKADTKDTPLHEACRFSNPNNLTPISPHQPSYIYLY